MEECLFCKIIKKEISSEILYEDDEVLVFLDIDQSTLGHTLIIPKCHITDYTLLDKEIIFKMFSIAQKIQKILMKKLDKNGISLLFNYGESQVIKHVHLHLLPNFLKEESSLTSSEVYKLLADEF